MRRTIHQRLRDFKKKANGALHSHSFFLERLAARIGADASRTGPSPDGRRTMGRSGWMTPTWRGLWRRRPISQSRTTESFLPKPKLLHAPTGSSPLSLVGRRELVSDVAADVADLALQVGFRDALFLCCRDKTAGKLGIVLRGSRCLELLCGVNAVFNPEVDELESLAHLSLPAQVGSEVKVRSPIKQDGFEWTGRSSGVERLSKMIGFPRNKNLG